MSIDLTPLHDALNSLKMSVSEDGKDVAYTNYEHVGDDKLAEARKLGQNIIAATEGAAVVYPWRDAPACFKAFSQNGGDEDFVILHEGDAYWTYKLVVCDEDTYHVVNNIYVTITCHS